MSNLEQQGYGEISEAYNFIRGEVLTLVEQIVSRQESSNVGREEGIDVALLSRFVHTHLAIVEESITLLDKLITLHRQGKLDSVSLSALVTWG
jgi:hypothetical protein